MLPAFFIAMAEELTALTVKAEVRWTFSNTLDLSTAKDVGALRYSQTFTNGTGDNQSNQMWTDERRVTPSSGTDDLDLAGALSNAYGTTVTFSKIKGVFLWNRGVSTDGGSTFTVTDGEDLLVGGAGAAGNAWGTIFNGNQDAEITVPSGAVFTLPIPLTGLSVTAGTGDILRVLLSGSGSNDVYYQIVLWGVKA